MKKKIRVAVLMGGKSAEHEISLASGREVAKNLDPNKYDVIPNIKILANIERLLSFSLLLIFKIVIAL